MDPVSVWPAAIATLVALSAAFVLKRHFGEPSAAGRFAAIDGLRGFLAFFVFLHHTCIWYFYLRTGRWEVPPSNLYTHFGQSAVALFFMITAFLFFSKLIDGRKRPIDWGRLYISRVLRLVPMYLVAMAGLFVIVAILAGGNLRQPVPALLQGMLQWLGFTMFAAPDLNDVSNTGIIVAGVTWSLPYEWVFYLLLPLLALTVRVVPPARYFLAGALGLLLFAARPNLNYLIFAGGIAAALLVRFDQVRRLASHPAMSWLALLCLGTAVLGFATVYRAVPLTLLTLFFVIVAAGNTLFGLLDSPTSRTLGEMAYSVYLLHGIVLFVTFHFIIGPEQARTLSALAHWTLAIGMTPVLVCLSFFTFRFVEQPAMQMTNPFTSWLRNRIGRAAPQVQQK